MPPELLPRPPGIILLTRLHLVILMYQEGVGVTLGAQVRHLVTYRDRPEGALIYTVFTKKVSKTVQKGGTPYF